MTPALIAHQRLISAPRISPNGRSIACASESDGRTDLFVTSDDVWPRQITAEYAASGSSYAWSPDSRHLVFTAAADGKLWLVPACGGRAARLTHIEGHHHTPRFSPDGRLVSFVSDREDEVDIVVIAIDGTSQRTLNRGPDFPMDPSWSPDGRRLVWHAYPNTLMPWDESSLVLAELDGGAPRTIASARRTAFANARFSPDGAKLICVCDRGGALNVTEMSVDGNDIRTLHDDAWEHGEPAYAPDGETIVYTRNVDGDVMLWTAPSGGGPARALTSEPGRATAPGWSPDGQRVIYQHESPVAPPDIWEVDVAAGRRRQRSFSALGGIEAAQLTLPEHVIWSSPDGFEVHGLLYTPGDVVPGQHGCLVDIHGGPMNQSRAIWDPLLQFLVQRGWVVVQPNYRGTLGYGRAYREALFGSWGEGDLADNLGGIDLCLERGLVREDRVVAWGGSAGGYSTLVCLTRAPARFAAGVALFGIYDLYAFGLETHRYERYYVETILGPSSENYSLWHDRSPLNFVERLRAPVLLLHGALDPAALPAQSDALVKELERHGIDHEYALYSGEGHGFRKVTTRADYATRMDRFLCQKVLRSPHPGPLGTLPYPPMPAWPLRP